MLRSSIAPAKRWNYSLPKVESFSCRPPFCGQLRRLSPAPESGLRLNIERFDMAAKLSPVDFTVNPVPTLSALVDKLGGLNSRLSKLNAEAEIIKIQLKASGMDEVLGGKYRAKIIARDSMRLDTGMVKSILSPSQIIGCSVASRSISVCLYDL